MRTSTVILSAALLVSVAASAWLSNELRSEREHSAQLVNQLERASRETSTTVEVAVTPASAPAPAPAASSTTASLEKTTPAAEISKDGQQDWQAYQRRLMSDPKYREARRAQERLKFSARHANLIKLLGFTPEQADAAIELDIDEEFFWQAERTSSPGSEEARLEAKARHEAFERQQQDKLRALLGEEKRARLQGYMESRESRMQVENLRSDLTEASALRDDQIEPLIAALHVERDQMKSELREYRDTLNWDSGSTDSWRKWSARRTELMKSMNTRMLSSASSVLTQPQLKALEDQLQHDLAQHEAQLRLHEVKANTYQRPAIGN